jgi:hypothetical protein
MALVVRICPNQMAKGRGEVGYTNSNTFWDTFSGHPKGPPSGSPSRYVEKQLCGLVGGRWGGKGMCDLAPAARPRTPENQNILYVTGNVAVMRRARRDFGRILIRKTSKSALWPAGGPILKLS